MCVCVSLDSVLFLVLVDCARRDKDRNVPLDCGYAYFFLKQREKWFGVMCAALCKHFVAPRFLVILDSPFFSLLCVHVLNTKRRRANHDGDQQSFIVCVRIQQKGKKRGKNIKHHRRERLSL